MAETIVIKDREAAEVDSAQNTPLTLPFVDRSYVEFEAESDPRNMMS